MASFRGWVLDPDNPVSGLISLASTARDADPVPLTSARLRRPVMLDLADAALLAIASTLEMEMDKTRVHALCPVWG